MLNVCYNTYVIHAFLNECVTNGLTSRVYYVCLTYVVHVLSSNIFDMQVAQYAVQLSFLGIIYHVGYMPKITSQLLNVVNFAFDINPTALITLHTFKTKKKLFCRSVAHIPNSYDLDLVFYNYIMKKKSSGTQFLFAIIGCRYCLHCVLQFSS